MTAELTVLALATLWQVIQITLAALGALQHLGLQKLLSPRDQSTIGGTVAEVVPEKTARLYRAVNNHFEALALYIAATVVVVVSGHSSSLTQTCAWVFLASRIIYLPAYYLGWSPGRSIIWAVGLAATLIMLIAGL